jgi:hypothetical protein
LINKKGTDKKRLILDLRSCNSRLKPLPVSLAQMSELIDQVSAQKARYYTCLDLFSGFWQIKQSGWKTYFLHFDEQSVAETACAALIEQAISTQKQTQEEFLSTSSQAQQHVIDSAQNGASESEQSDKTSSSQQDDIITAQFPSAATHI